MQKSSKIQHRQKHAQRHSFVTHGLTWKSVCLLIVVQEVQRGVVKVERTVFNKTGESLQRLHVSLLS